MNKILREYEKIVHLTKNNDDWKSIDISRINLAKFFKKNLNLKKLNNNLEESEEKRTSINLKDQNSYEILIKNNCIIKDIKTKFIKISYDKKKIFKKNIEKTNDVDSKIKNLNYVLSPYFINILVDNNTKKKTIIINNVIQPGLENFFHQKNEIKIGNNCDICIIEKFTYIGIQKYISNICSNIYAGENSRVDYYCLKESCNDGIQIFNQNSYLQKNTKINFFLFAYGQGIQYIKKTCNLINLNSKANINSIN